MDSETGLSELAHTESDDLSCLWLCAVLSGPDPVRAVDSYRRYVLQHFQPCHPLLPCTSRILSWLQA